MHHIVRTMWIIVAKLCLHPLNYGVPSGEGNTYDIFVGTESIFVHRYIQL